MNPDVIYVRPDVSYLRLKIAYVALERFREAMDKKYQRDPSTSDRWGLNDADLTEYVRLSLERSEATRGATEETIDRVIDEGGSI